MDPSNAASTSGGFDCEFENRPKELQSECSICLLILREPHQTTCCGYSFCQGCIEQIKATIDPVCPLCKSKFSIYHNKWLKRQLDQQRVYCTHKKDGCDWVGPLGKLDEHLNYATETDNLTTGCGFVPVKCHDCNETVPRKGYGVHISDLCEKRPFSCEHCGEYNSTYLDVINNHWPKCPCHPVECVNKCGAHPKRKDRDQHVDFECPLTSIVCEFCPAQVLRGEMHEHLVLNLTTHISLMVNPLHEKLDKAEEEIHKLTDEYQYLQNDVEEEIRKLTDENQYLQDDVKRLCLCAHKNEEEIRRLREDNLETQSLYSEIRQQNEYLRVDYEDLKQKNTALNAKIEELSEKIESAERERKSATSKTFHGHQIVTTASKQGSCRNLLDYDRYYESYVSHSDSDSESSQRWGAKYPPGREIACNWEDDEQSSIPPVVLKMSNYSGYKSGQMGEYWMSEPFYSDTKPSYKLRLSVRASRNLSVFVRLMRGEFDNELAWPFNANITIQLMNHGSGRDWERTIVFKYGHRIIRGDAAGDRGEVRGDPNFIALYENSSFVKNNTLWFRVLCVELINHKDDTYNWWS